jgi:hypothetical protein
MEKEQKRKILHKEFDTIIHEFEAKLKEFQNRNSDMRMDLQVELKEPRTVGIYDMPDKLIQNKAFLFDTKFILITE